MSSLYMAKNVLNGGEISPAMAARFDQQRSQTGCESLLNFVPMAQGGIVKRPGMEHLKEEAWAYGGLEDPDLVVRLIPFIFSAGESRMLELVWSRDYLVWISVYDEEGRRLARFKWEAVLPETLRELVWTQSADVIFLAHHRTPPMKICRYSDTDWRIERVKMKTQTSAPEIRHAEVKGAEGKEAKVTLKYVATAINAETGEESLPSRPVILKDAAALGSSVYAEIEIEPMEGISEYRIYKMSAGVYGFVGRISVADAEAEEEEAGADGGAESGEGEAAPLKLVFEDHNYQADTEDTPPREMEGFSGLGEWPNVVFLHQQRLGFASSDKKPMTIWLSQAGNFESFMASVPPRDDDAIEVTLAAAQANRILWCASDRSGLAIGTEGGEWNLTNGEGGAISPTALSFDPQTFHGSEPGLPPLRCGQDLLFVQRGARRARVYGYSFQSDRYESADLSLLAHHIFQNGGGIADWTWQPEPLSVIWLVLRDGTLASLTYMRDNDVIAWARHQTAGLVAAIAAIPSPDGSWQVWLETLRPRGGKYSLCLERLRNFQLQEITPAISQENPNPFTPDYFRDGLNNAPFSAQCVPCLPDADIKDGTTFLRFKKINAVKFRVINSAPFTAHVLSQNLPHSPTMNVPARPANFSAPARDWDCPLGAGFREAAKLQIISNTPTPLTILGMTLTIEISSESGGQERQ